MSRRSALPGADELFRSTGDSSRPVTEAGVPTLERVPDPESATAALTALGAPPAGLATAGGAELTHAGLDEASAAVRTSPRRRPRAVEDRRPSGRERHEEKITVYVSHEELMDLEQARLTLRGDFGLPVDRGRVVREALAVVLADFDAKGDASILVRRLRGH